MCERDGDGIAIGRRRIIHLGGTALFVGAAGCTDRGGNEDGTDTSRPPLTVTKATTREAAIYPDETLEITGTVENGGDRAGTFYAELRIDGVIVDTEEVAIAAGDTEPVTFTHAFDEPGEYEVSINDVPAGTVRVERPPAEFEIVDTAIGRTTVGVGEEVGVRTTIGNVGGREGIVTAELQVDGLSVETREISIDAGAEKVATFTHAFDGPGRYEVSVNAEASADASGGRTASGNETTVATVSVVPPAEFEIVDTTIDRTTIRVGGRVEVTATVTNVGDLEGVTTIELERDGRVIATREETIAPAETATVRFSVGFEKRGAYGLGVDGVGVGTVYVRECSVVVSEAVTVDGRSSQTYEFELKDHVDITATATTRGGVDPTLTIVGPSGDPLVDGVTGGSIRETVTTAEAGRHEIGFENGALLPWRNGTWAVEIEICTW